MRFINERLNLDMTKTLFNGETQIPEFVFFGDQGVTIELRAITEPGTVSIDFRQGRL